ncbi:hypothetical protein AJ80_05421 [Polytolypa hystricis UAMH7299]|uniref:Uncharacterized protein n=1 Tax=Polytolypa hystricis (strain UAMH7299) TaxID=1447883 RepID=A0A2B7Y3V4_POLH7|nr:hypothetical protein AJ80_05421 [Polytolypa hystricis UAMH7299]
MAPNTPTYHPPTNLTSPLVPQSRPGASPSTDLLPHGVSEPPQARSELRARSIQSSARERQHGALNILRDREVLMFQAVAHNESIPQTRRLYMHHFIGLQHPGNFSLTIGVRSNENNTGSTAAQGNTGITTTATATGVATTPASAPAPAANRPGPGPTTAWNRQRRRGPIVDIIEADEGWRTDAQTRSTTSGRPAPSPSRRKLRGGMKAPGSQASPRRG